MNNESAAYCRLFRKLGVIAIIDIQAYQLSYLCGDGRYSIPMYDQESQEPNQPWRNPRDRDEPHPTTAPL